MYDARCWARRSKRSADSIRAAPLDAASSREPSDASAAPSGPWNPAVAWETPISNPAGSTRQPAGVTGAAARADGDDGVQASTTPAQAAKRRDMRDLQLRWASGGRIVAPDGRPRVTSR